MKHTFLLLLSVIVILLPDCSGRRQQTQEFLEEEEITDDNRPNILLAIADDMSWIHAGFMGCKAVQTPAIDYLASNGVWFSNAYCSAPSCSASRASLLTGRNGWELKEGACLWSLIPAKFKTYTEYLEASGYFTGFTGKGWGPGDWTDSARKKNPAGESFNEIRKIPYEQFGEENPVSQVDYAANFEQFLRERPEGMPFCFWYGAFEPHRPYLDGIGKKLGKNPGDVEVPGFLPDVPEIRSDILDYLVEIEWFDNHIGKMIEILRKTGELDNTIIVVTSDNGMPFPRAKANLYDYGTHMPLVVYCRKLIPGGRKVNDLVSLIDLAPTFLDAAGLPVPGDMAGKSLMEILNSNVSGMVDQSREKIFTFRERHAWVQPEGQVYPMRAMRKNDFLVIWNPKHNMHPAGSPELKFNFNYYPFGDVDNSPSKDFILSINENEGLTWYYKLAFAKRPEFELYNITKDPYQLKNLAGVKEYSSILIGLINELKQYLRERGDLRMSGKEEIYYKAPYYSQKGLESGGLYLKEWNKLNDEEKKLAIERELKVLEKNEGYLKSLGWSNK